ncbi:MAG: nicotinate phosphoribosyltransferase, partial [Pseudomonadota bacterium]
MSTISSPLFTDLYQFTMMQCYRTYGLNNKVACFDLFFRHNPFNGSYAVIAGIEAGLKFLEALHFRHTEISYLKSLGLFDKNFLQGLKKFHFTGDVYAVEEGTVGFPLAPIMRVEGPLDQCQLVETALLNIINFQTLIASKAARICQEAGYENVLEFGLRRAQGPDGGLTASRAAYVGGVSATSNVLAGKTYGIPVRGTHSHSWVMAHTSELEAFRRYAQVYPNNAVLLVDTYDTLKCGIPNAIEVGLEMEKKGQRLQGIRLDSGDLTYLSIEARKMLDGAGLPDCRIIASGDLDEWIIRDIKAQGAKIDIFGVGTKLASADGDSALSGVYKLAAIKNKGESWQMRLKMADGSKKATYPGPKQVWRLFGADQD